MFLILLPGSSQGWPVRTIPWLVPPYASMASACVNFLQKSQLECWFHKRIRMTTGFQTPVSLE